MNKSKNSNNNNNNKNKNHLSINNVIIDNRLKSSDPKPIEKKQVHLLKFGMFSKSPKLTNNRIETKSNDINKHNHDKYGNINQLSTAKTMETQTNSINAIKRLSNSTDNSTPKSQSNSNSNSLEMDNRSNPIFFPNDNKLINQQQSMNNTRYNQLMKEYVDTESTVSSSDIQDDISSVASDEPSNSLKRPPRNAPPPPPHARPPPLPIPHRSCTKHIKSQSQSLTASNMMKYSKPYITSQDTSSLKLSLDEIHNKINKSQHTKHEYSKSAFSTPNDSPNIIHERGRGRVRGRGGAIQFTEADRHNPYMNMIDFNNNNNNNNNNNKEKEKEKEGLNDNNNDKIEINGLPPPPLSPRNSGNHHNHHNMKPNGSKRGLLHNYRARTNSLPYYEIPQTLKTSKSHSKLLPSTIPLNKSRSVNNTEVIRPKLNGRTVSEDITHYEQNYHHQKQNRLHQRANSARNVDDLSLSEKLYQNRRTVLHRLSRGKNKKDVMSKLDISIGKVEDKLKIYVRNLVSLQDELNKINQEMNKQLEQWENINNFSLTNLCRSYYSNFGLLIQIRIEIATKYCECFRDKYRQLKKTRDRIKKDAKKYSLDDLVLTVEAAMMTASNIRLPQDINTKRDNEKSLSLVIKELKKKYSEKKYEDIIQPMTSQDRTKHILTMLVQIIDTSNKTTMTKNVSDGLPYFHPQDNGYQVPFEQLLYDPRFQQKKTIDDFISKYVLNNNDEINIKIIDRENLSLTKISTFIYKLTNSFLDSCELNKNSPFFQKLFWDCTNLMIGRSIFPKFINVIKYIINKDIESIELDNKYKQQLNWMSDLNQKQIGIETEFQYHYKKKNGIKTAMLQRKGTIFVDEESENLEKIAYYAAISRLRDLPNIIVPQDSIVLVIDTIHDIQKTAVKYSKMNKKNKNKNKKNKNKNMSDNVIISGDSLFPIVVYCLIQSNVDYWNKWIFMMKKFYTQKILSFGQTGFCFSLINAAVTYILQQKPKDFGL